MKKILIIEDDDTLRENTAEILELSGYDTVVASDGQMGVYMAEKEIPDAIVCDIMMPKLDGYGVIEKLSKEEKTKYIPFIFLSAKTDRSDIRKGMNLGADDYITKPFDDQELIDAIESRIAKVAILKDQRVQEEEIRTTQENVPNLETLHYVFRTEGSKLEFKPGEIIYEEGRRANFMFFIEHGAVKQHQLEVSGKELITSLLHTDDVFGYTSFSENQSYKESATALEQTLVYGLSKDYFLDLLKENHSLVLNIIELLTSNLYDIKEDLIEMAYSSVKKKTAQTILKFAEKLQKSPDEAIRISRNDLAGVAGIATESLIRTLSNFKKMGLIEIEGRNIRILDIESLQEIE